MQFSLSNLLGLGVQPTDLSLAQVSLRAIIVFVSTLIIVRLAEKRFLARLNALDAILGFILASMLARAINGSGPFFPTLAAGLLLVVLHRLFTLAAFHSEAFGILVKGREEVVIRDGKIDSQTLRRNHLTEKDLLEELRLNGRLESIEKVKKAVIERRGEVSVIQHEE